MKSEKYIEWDKYFRQGHTILRIGTPELSVQQYTRGSYIRIPSYYDLFEKICLTERINVAPKFFDQTIHKVNRLWKYYTFKQYPGAVIFLGSK